MKTQLTIIILLVSKLSFAQWPELQERYLYNVYKVEVWYHNLKKDAFQDSALLNIRFYSKYKELTEYRYDYYHVTNDKATDTSQYDAEQYYFDTVTRSKITKFIKKGGSVNTCIGWSGHPRKKIEMANEKGQLIEAEIIDEESSERFIYSYDENDLLVQVKWYIKNDLIQLFVLKYTFY